MRYLQRILRKIKPITKINSIVDKTSKIEGGGYIIDSTMDRYSFCGRNCHINNTKIGSFCSIAGNVKIGLGTHPINWVSTSCAFYKGRDSISKRLANLEYSSKPKQTIIEHDVWIGEDAIIKDGVHIGVGAIIGSGAVVTKDIGPYEIYAGVPARFIRKRFSDKLIGDLLDSEWWKLPESKLKELSYAMNEPQLFIELLKDSK